MLYNRQYKLIIGSFEITELNIEFNVKLDDTARLNGLELKVYNVNKSRYTNLIKTKTTIKLYCGYSGNIGLIFSGEVKEFSVSNNVLYLKAYEQLTTFSNLFISLTDIKSDQDLINKLAQESHLQLGIIDTADSKRKLTEPYNRPRSVHGYFKNLMRDLAFKYNATYYMLNNTINLVNKNFKAQGQTVEVINSSSGLLNNTEVLKDGRIRIKLLLRYNLNINSMVLLQSKEYNGYYIVKAISYSGIYDASGDWVVSLELEELKQ